MKIEDPRGEGAIEQIFLNVPCDLSEPQTFIKDLKKLIMEQKPPSTMNVNAEPFNHPLKKKHK